MGMAASQARFLQLTARRTNIEYQGQQINQQRLALANASAGLFEKMLNLETPVPPSSQDDKYYKQGYNFTDVNDGIQKNITWTTGEIDTSDLEATYTVTNAAGVATTVTVASIGDLADPTDPEMQKLTNAIGNTLSSDQLALGYTQVIRNVQITHNVYDPDGNYTQVKKEAPALLQFDNLNRLLNATLLDKPALDMQDTASLNSKAQHIGGGESLTYSGVFDEVSYQNDVNKYEFQKASYDYQIEQINQQTKQIQQQDKSLELKMKQLDTEHNAVQTEMEAVQKVIQKNIEGSFKTFA